MHNRTFGCCPEDLDEALAEINDLLSLQQLDKEYALIGALHEIGEILCRERLRMKAEGMDYQSGISIADLRKLSKTAAREKKNQAD